MTAENDARVSSAEPSASHDKSQSRPRKKRKWDQPAKPLVAAGVATIPGTVLGGNMAPLSGISLPGVPSVPGALLTNQLVTNSTAIPPVFQMHSFPQSTATLAPKSIQPKTQDELIIAREIVINDAESSIRYKLTKRQTQEEIQRCTGAVVITRGKYRPPNAAPDGERPLYLHISAAVHLKDTAERILAVDRAAAMVEEMLKQGPNSQLSSSTGLKALSACVFLGFDADPSLNIAARIRGPNDQYINHIMNETGATVALKGCGSGNCESLNDREVEPQLHLYLTANNSKSLEDAKRLAENLLDTVSVECGASRSPSCKVYTAIPPPQQLLSGVQCSTMEHKPDTSVAVSLAFPEKMGSTLPIPASSVTINGTTSVLPQVAAYPSVNFFHPQPSAYIHPQPLVNGGTSYNGYAGIYPQATPLQQVALALRQSTSPLTSTVAPTTSVAGTISAPSVSSSLEKEKRLTQRRKFQELPVGSMGSSKAYQGPVLSKDGEQVSADSLRNISTMPPPKALVQSSSNAMPPPPPPKSSNGMPPPRTMPPPPPPPKFSSTETAQKQQEKNIKLNKSNSVVVSDIPDTLVKLMEYGEDDDDPDESNEEHDLGNSKTTAVKKPFWAL